MSLKNRIVLGSCRLGLRILKKKTHPEDEISEFGDLYRFPSLAIRMLVRTFGNAYVTLNRYKGLFAEEEYGTTLWDNFHPDVRKEMLYEYQQFCRAKGLKKNDASTNDTKFH